MKRWLFVFGVLLFFVSLFFDDYIAFFFLTLRNPVFDYVAVLFSYTWFHIFLFLVVPFFLIWVDSKRSAILFGLSIGLVALITFILKFLVLRPRPFAALALPLVASLSYSFSWFNSSFPSSHASTSFSSLAAVEKLQKLRAVWFLLVLVSVLTRLYAGLHYFSDVIAGALLGYFLTFFIMKLDKTKFVRRKFKFDLEFRRQVFHLCLGIVILALLFFGVIDVAVLIVVFLVGLVFALLSLKFRIPFVDWFLERFERKDTFPGKGALFFFLGSILSLLIFPWYVALASIAILTFGDSIAPLVGVYFGRNKSKLNGRKFVEGFVVGFFVAFAAASFFVPLVAALIGSFFGMLFEFLEIKFKGYPVDDNLFVPLISGAVIYFVMM
ncbi:MAG: phosphatase PAP2 family protein, partial [archaeon]